MADENITPKKQAEIQAKNKELMIKLEKAMPCMLNKKHKQTVTKLNGRN